MDTSEATDDKAFFDNEHFVGREEELAGLVRSFDDSVNGRGSVNMLVGEPGIGKTSTARVFASICQSRGATVLWGRCYEEGGAPSYWPWLQVLREHIRDMTPEALRSAMGVGGQYIAEIVPEINDKCPEITPARALDPEQSRFRLFDSVSGYFQRSSETQPLVIVIDDLQWADRSTLLLLEYVARETTESGVVIVGTFRDTDLNRDLPLSRSLGDLARLERFQRLTLVGLEQPEIQEIVRVRTGTVPPQRLTLAVQSRTDGNPFFVSEIVRMLERAGPIREDETSDVDWLARLLPDGVVDAVRRRFDYLSEDCRQFLTVASAIGKEFSFGLSLRLMPDVPEDRMLLALDDALEASIIEESDASREVYRFSHDIVRETLQSGISAARRSRLHARIGEALEEVHGGFIELHAAEIAQHYEQAESVVAPKKLVRFMTMAGDQALLKHAYEDAQSYYERGLFGATGQIGIPMSADDGATAQILFGIGRAQAATLQRNRLQEAADSLGKSARYYLDSGDVASAVSVLEYRLPTVPGFQGLADLIGRTLDVLDTDSHEAGRLLTAYGRAIGLVEGGYERAIESFTRAIAIARREHDEALEMDALVDSCAINFFHLNWDRVINDHSRAIALARSLDDTRAEVSATLFASQAMYATGNHDSAAAYAERLLRLGERLRDRYYLANALWINEMVASACGDWQAATYFSDRALEQAPQDSRLVGTRVFMEFQIGNYESGNVYINRLIDTMRSTEPNLTTEYAFVAWIIPLIASIANSEEHMESASRAAMSVMRSNTMAPIHRLYANVGKALLAVREVDELRASEAIETLATYAGSMIVGGLSADRLLGLVSSGLGRFNDSESYFGAAIEFCRASGYLPELGRASVDLAQVLVDQSKPDSVDRINRLLDEADRIAVDLGMPSLSEKTGGLREAIEASHSAASVGGLTPREIEVLQLVALGKTNREIANDLTISMRTVDHHMGNVLSKTDSANRAEAASYAIRHGLAT